MQQRATLVVPSFKRVANLKAIVERAAESEVVSEVIIWHNGEPFKQEWIDLVLPSPLPVHLLHIGQNCFVYGRFKAASQASNELIVTCDDDWLVDSWDRIVAEFWKGYDGRTSIYAEMPDGHLRMDKGLRFDGMHEVLIAWGAVFMRSWVEQAFGRWKERWGEDYLLHRKADRIFSMLLQTEHRVAERVGENLPGYNTSGVALYTRRDHVPLTEDARRRCVEIVHDEEQV